MKSEQRCLWMSRVSFLVSAAALASFGYRELSDGPTGEAGLAVEQTVSLGAVAGLAAAAKPQPRAGTSSVMVSEALVRTATPSQAIAPVMGAPTLLRAQAPQQSLARQASVKEHAPVQVKRLVVTEAVEDREPVDVAAVVNGDHPVFAFVELATGQGAEQQLVVSFEHETGSSTGVVNLNVPANQTRWRTWGRTHTINRDGRWSAVVRDGQGAVLGRTEFTVRSTSS